MPNIIKKYDFPGLPYQNIYQDCLDILKEMGVANIQELGSSDSLESRTITGVAPSIWGWGGMKLEVKVYSTNDTATSLELNGFIAQLGVSPLTAKMDEFLLKLHNRLSSKYNHDFQYEKLTRFLPNYKLNFSKTDLVIILLIVIVTFVTTFASVFGNFGEGFFIGPVLGLGYYLGRKFLFRDKKDERSL